ncbi:spermine oxidase-like [Frankliniella occidentalis]|uniref:Spermine oxidase-like n=1 Tax=Frankliniella occidentalis TaxID=133901 RepID=A0A6J1SS47_FRAOC|nr:spermine oxidase-like [Frankliniella occidentalis]
MTSHYKVVVVGAGAAGIAAGTKLLEKGFTDFVILESEFRIGGRIHTVAFNDNLVDLGAQYCHGQTGNVVYEMASPFNILESSVTGTNMGFALSNGEEFPRELAEGMMTVCLEIMEESKTQNISPNECLGQYMTSQFGKYVDADCKTQKQRDLCWSFLDWFHRFENASDGSDSWFETSLLGNSEYRECEGDLTLSWKNVGFKRILDIMMRRCPNPAMLIRLEPKIHLGKEVTKIQWECNSSGHILLHCLDGSKYTAEKVLLTVSLGVLKEQSGHLFEPELPEAKLTVIRGLSMGTVNKILLKFTEIWWPKDIAGFSFIWTQADTAEFKENLSEDSNKKWLLDVFGFYQYHSQPGVLCGWVVGESARIMENCTIDVIKAGCQELLERFLGDTYQIPLIHSLIRSSWYSNRNFRGSYSFRSMESEQLGAKATGLAEPVLNSKNEEVLLFAGEATHEHFFSTVHGAIESGWREANRITEHYKSETEVENI